MAYVLNSNRIGVFMAKKNNNDAFADLSYDNADVYKRRNEEQKLRNKAEDVDLQILEFSLKPKTIEWAKSADSMCKKFKEALKGLEKYSTEIKSLDNIKKEAEEIIKAEVKRKKDEKEALELKRIEQELKTLERNQKLVEETIAAIDSVIKRERDSTWLLLVKNVELTIKGMKKDVLENVTNRFFVDDLVKEAKLVSSAIDYDDKIRRYSSSKIKDKAWAQDVLKIKDDDNYIKVLDYVKEDALYKQLVLQAYKAKYASELEEIRKFVADNYKYCTSLNTGVYEKIKDHIRKIELAVELKVLDSKLASDYPTAFKNCDEWLEKDRQERLLKEQELKKQREIEEKKKEKIAKLRSFGMRTIEIIVALAIVIIGITSFSTTWGKYVVGCGGTGVYLYACLRILFALPSYRKMEAFNRVMSTITLLFAIATSFVPVINCFSLPMAVAGVVMLQIAFFKQDMNSPYEYVLVSMQYIALAVTCFVNLGAIVTVAVLAVFTIVELILGFKLRCDIVISSARFICELVVLGVIAFLGISNFTLPVGKYLLTGGAALAVGYYYMRIVYKLDDDYKETAAKAIMYISTLLVFGLTIACAVLPIFNIFEGVITYFKYPIALLALAMLEYNAFGVHYRNFFSTLVSLIGYVAIAACAYLNFGLLIAVIIMVVVLAVNIILTYVLDNRTIRSASIVTSVLAIVGAGVYFGFINKDAVWGVVLALVALTAGCIFVYTKFIKFLDRKDFHVEFFAGAITTVMLILTVFCMATPSVSLFTYPLIIVSIAAINYNIFGLELENNYHHVLTILSYFILSLALFISIGGTTGALISGGTLLGTAFLGRIYREKASFDKDIHAAALWLGFLLTVVAAVIMWWFRWDFIIFAAFMIASAFVYTFFVSDIEENDNGWLLCAAASVVGIVLGLVSIGVAIF